MASGLSSILGGLAQGFTDLGKSAADMFGGAATNNALTVGLDALLNKKSFEQASADARQRQNDYRKWLYDTDSTKDAAAKGLGTALNGAQTALDLIPGLGQTAPVNALQGALGGLSDEFKFNGENYNLGNAAKRAALSAGVGVTTGGLGKALANSGNKVLSNGVLRGATTGALGGALAQAGNTAIEGGTADEILRSAAQGASGGALLGAGTGAVQSLQGALARSRARNNAPAIMDEEVVMAEYAPEQNAVADIANEPKIYYHGSPETDITEFDIGRAGRNTRSGEKAIYFTDTPETAEEFAYERIPTESNFIDKAGKHGGVYEVNLDMRNTLDLDNLTDDQIKELWPYASRMGSWQGEDVFARDIKRWRDVKNPQLIKGYLDLEKLANSPYDSFSATMYPNTDNKAKEYGIFDATKAKIIKAPKAGNVEVMAERVAPGQLGLFDQTATKAPETSYSQLGLFDTPVQPKTIDTADVNPYAPVNGQITQTMRDRAAEVLGNYENGLPENELYNRIRPETMPAEGIDILSREAAGMKLKDRKEYITKSLFGDKGIEGASLDELLDVYYADHPKNRESMRQKIKDLDIVHKNTPAIKEHILRNTKDTFTKRVKQRINKAAEAPSQRSGKTGALDAALSERLGIAPGNTNKRQAKYDMEKSAKGRYRPDAREIAVSEKLPQEDALSTMAHERLHSFQTESKSASGRYDNEVNAAYKELQQELKPLLHNMRQIRKDHYGNYGYYSEPIEQEARMLQDYLDAKGYTDANRRGRGEYGEEVYPAFDKFFDKLRDLSKRGIALPAILAALGGGSYMANQEEDENNNGQQI